MTTGILSHPHSLLYDHARKLKGIGMEKGDEPVMTVYLCIRSSMLSEHEMSSRYRVGQSNMNSVNRDHAKKV